MTDHARDLIEQSAATEREADVLLLTVKQYASLLGIHVQSVYSQIRYGRCKFPTTKVSTARKAPIRIVVPRGSINTLKHA